MHVLIFDNAFRFQLSVDGDVGEEACFVKDVVIYQPTRGRR